MYTNGNVFSVISTVMEKQNSWLFRVATIQIHDKYPSRALLVDLDNRKTLYDNECFDFTLYPIDTSKVRHADRLIPMDYNGDGKTDICLININGTYVYEFTGNGFKQLAYSNALNIMYFNFERN